MYKCSVWRVDASEWRYGVCLCLCLCDFLPSPVDFIFHNILAFINTHKYGEQIFNRVINTFGTNLKFISIDFVYFWLYSKYVFVPLAIVLFGKLAGTAVDETKWETLRCTARERDTDWTTCETISYTFYVHWRWSGGGRKLRVDLSTVNICLRVARWALHDARPVTVPHSAQTHGNRVCKICCSDRCSCMALATALAK